MQYQAEQHVALKDVGAAVAGPAEDSLRTSTPGTGKTSSLRDLKGCLAGRKSPPTEQEIATAIANAQDAGEKRNGGTAPVQRFLPKRAPGQPCSIKDLKGCLAGRGKGPVPSIEEMDEVIAHAIWERYLRSFA